MTNEEAFESEDELTVTLEFEDGTSEECDVIAIFGIGDEEENEEDYESYIALAPDNGTDDIYFYGYNEIEDGGFKLRDITDDEEFEVVAEVFDDIMSEEEE